MKTKSKVKKVAKIVKTKKAKKVNVTSPVRKTIEFDVSEESAEWLTKEAKKTKVSRADYIRVMLHVS